jgi:glycerate kinase
VSAPVLVAPDKFKGTFSAAEVAAAVARGLRSEGREVDELPIADGGEGTMDALGGDVRSATVADPLGGPVEARFSLLDERTAVVEAAQASGLWRLAEDERDAWGASTRGTGELIAAAAEAGARTVIVACGGTAATDGGAGALAALEEAGVRPEIVAACDVRTAWEDAPRVFGPQKGADAATVRRLERRLATLAARAPRDPRGVPLTGCGGGLSGGLWAHLGARLEPGAGLVLDALGFDERLGGSAFVVTGEGRLDEQTLAGKAVAEVAVRCRQRGVGCHAVVGESELDAFSMRQLDLGRVIEASTLTELEEAGRELGAG